MQTLSVVADLKKSVQILKACKIPIAELSSTDLELKNLQRVFYSVFMMLYDDRITLTCHKGGGIAPIYAGQCILCVYMPQKFRLHIFGLQFFQAVDEPSKKRYTFFANLFEN